ncbi:MAG: ComEC/Rec2 family competence protein [Puniceicoccales bacterium]|jgi:competence protein ComEC|nr:ComEC/Rec2 family competence protein [Puniceicoccales bacterium]
MWQIDSAPPNPSHQAKQHLEIHITKVATKYFRSGLYAYGKGIIKDAEDRVIIDKPIYFMLKTNSANLFQSQSFKTYAAIEKIDNLDKNNSFFSYLYRSKVFLYASNGTVEKITDNGTKLFELYFIAHEKINQGLTKNTTKSFLSILPGMLLSSKTNLSKEQKNSFHNTGTAHLLAVSGLHMGIIGFSLELLLRILGLRKKFRRIPCLVIAFLYLGIIGSPPSASRAFIMLSFYWSACYFNRKPNTFSSLINAAVLSLLVNPVQLFDPGFRMSYGVAYYIILLGVPLANKLKSFVSIDKFVPKDEITASSKLLKKIIYAIIDSLAISLAANMASLPLIFEYFGSISLVGILANIVVIPVAWVTIIAGTLTILSLLVNIEAITNMLLFFAGIGAAAIENVLSGLEKYIPLFWSWDTTACHYGTTIFAIGLLILPFIRPYFQKIQKS